ncbi:hypothetical protein HGRIS_005406 [Hohenbuehelia grisea]|uniref:Uncharacterized protein n=1 Tax=Hohenbuehelia grisea TaxID=104357 RepID=A0ABR3JFZ3_9AGAR
MTDGAGSSGLPERRAQWYVMIRQYRHVMMAKRAGWGCLGKPLAAIPPGFLAVPCRACPVPLVNLPDDWKDAPLDRRWLYTLIVAQDANFRLKNRLRGADDKDPMLGPGFSYFVDPGAYAEYISQAVDHTEASNCAGFRAILNMLTKKTKGLRVTGVAGVSCARHELFRPLGLVNLFKGERHEGMPDELKLAVQQKRLRIKVPTFHLQAHNVSCHAPFSLDLTPGIGHVDGEGVERNWAALNAAAPSTKEMGPGSRQDTLDDFCGFANWKKTIGLGTSLLRRMVEAVPNYMQLTWNFRGLDDHLRLEHPEVVDEWSETLAKWQEDPGNENPYIVPDNNVSVADVRIRLAAKEEARILQGKGVEQELSASSFIYLGLEILDNQSSLWQDFPEGQTLPKHDVIKRNERRSSIQKKLKRFHEGQAIHMPSLAHVIGQQTAAEDTVPAEKLTADQRTRACSSLLVKVEDELREASAKDTICELHRHLRTRTFVNRWKVKNVTGQRPNTQARGVQLTVEGRISLCKVRYRDDREALLALRRLTSDLLKVLRPLQDSDVRALNERQLTEQELAKVASLRITGSPDEIDAAEVVGVVDKGEARRTLSWIWFSLDGTEGLTGDTMKDKELNAAVHAKWARAKARADRWCEEVVLVEEEMRRVLKYCEWRASWWISQADLRTNITAELKEGIRVYCSRRADMEHRLFSTFSGMWRQCREVGQRALEKVQGGDESFQGVGDVIVSIASTDPAFLPIRDWVI